MLNYELCLKKKANAVQILVFIAIRSKTSYTISTSTITTNLTLSGIVSLRWAKGARGNRAPRGYNLVNRS